MVVSTPIRRVEEIGPQYESIPNEDLGAASSTSDLVTTSYHCISSLVTGGALPDSTASKAAIPSALKSDVFMTEAPEDYMIGSLDEDHSLLSFDVFTRTVMKWVVLAMSCKERVTVGLIV